MIMVVIKLKEKAIGSLKSNESTGMSETLKAITVHAVYFFAGVLVSRGTVFGSYSPFGTALIASVPYSNVLTVLSGSFIGYILPSSINSGMRYIASIIATAAIRWALNDLKRLTSHPLYSPIIALLPILATGLAVSAIEGFTEITIIMSITESLLAAGAAYFFTQTVIFASGNRGITTLNQQEIACIAMTCCIMLLSFAGVDVKGISVGRILSILVILFCSVYGGVAGGSISGIATGILFSLASPSLSYISGAYSFAGLMAGIFSHIGRIGSATAFILCNAIVSFQTGDFETIIAGLYEVMAATLIFMVIPRSKGAKLSQIFAPQMGKISTDGVRRSIIGRLDFASRALSSVSDSVEKVSEKLSKISAPDIGGVYDKAIDKTCCCCALRMFCWDKEGIDTREAIESLTPMLKEGETISAEHFSTKFKDRCVKVNEMASSINKYYEDFSNREAAERRMDEIRSIITDQFLGTSEILKDMAIEFNEYENYDSVSSDRISYYIRNLGAVPIDVSCFTDRFGRMSVDIEVTQSDEANIRKYSFMREISKICDREMDVPCITTADGHSRIHASEKPTYDVKVGSARHICNNGKLCGDNFYYFNDGMGRMIAILSDGMGTGGKAAVDGAMASSIMYELSKAGISFDCALRIVNSALLIRAGDESLATLDISCVDMFNGKLDILKAGAPFTFIKRGNVGATIDAPSLPVGILKDIKFAKDVSTIGENDYVVMVSDGVLSDGENWVEKELEKWNGDGPQELADYIVEEAMRRREDGYDDDITALVLQLVKTK